MPTIPPHVYEPLRNVHDEMALADGTIREHWRPLVDMVSSLGPDEMARRWESSQKMLHENGVSYNIFSRHGAPQQTWQLDNIPLFIPEKEWESVERGVAQRASLLNAFLSDVYGAQRLLKQGVLPPALIFGNPHYLPPSHGAPAPARIVIYAADLVRGADGQWVVLTDRTQAPSGMVYALENRLAISRSMPELFSQTSIRRIRPFFPKLRETLAQLAPFNKDKPRVVLFTPGPYSETYFEHACLARHLGIPLAQGADLTVREGRVCLKAVQGLIPVDVILRRVDDDYCDPLELRDDSFLGVPGLVQASQDGSIAIANALGSGLAQDPAIMAHLPAICRSLLGEDLLMPSIRTWWCGQKEARRHVLGNLESLVIKPASYGSRRKAIFGKELDEAALETLRASILEAPASFSAQEKTTFSTAPCWVNGALRPRPISIRVHAIFNGTGYSIMPGGFARTPPDEGSTQLSMQQGAWAKDAWILSSKEEPIIHLSTSAPAILRSSQNLPSRIADHCFWLGRYMERVESLVRLLRAIVRALTEETSPLPASHIRPFANCLAARASLPPEALATAASCEQALSQAIFSTELPGSIADNFQRALRNFSALRDRLSNDMSRPFGEMQALLAPPSSQTAPQALATLNELIFNLSIFNGMMAENTVRAYGWLFLDLGRRIERALFSAQIALATLSHEEDTRVLELLLETCDSLLTYRYRYLSAPQLTPTLDLALLDESNPRSLAFQVASITAHLKELPHSGSANNMSREEKIAFHLLADLRLFDFDAPASAAAKREQISALAQASLREIPALSDLLTQTYFSHSEAQHGPEDPILIVD